MKRILKILGILIGLILAYLLFWPVKINPYAWTPPAAPDMAQGVYKINQKLDAVEKFSTAAFGHGGEDVAVDTNGFIYTGLDNGKILRFEPDGSQPTVWADTKGRPLGLHFDSLMNLIVADAQKGLLSVSPDGTVSVLTDGIDGYTFSFADDLDIGSDGTIYFSDASTIASTGNYRDDLFEHGPHGSLLAYDPASKSTRLLADSLYFANGIALSQNEDFVLINETSKYRIRRYWLKGPKAGTLDIFIENLPGFPDGVSANRNGTFWLALANPRNPALDQLLPSPFLRKMVYRIPEGIQPQPVHHGLVFGLNEAGEVIHNLQDPEGDFAPITSVEEVNGMLYLGTLTDNEIARIAAP